MSRRQWLELEIALDVCALSQRHVHEGIVLLHLQKHRFENGFAISLLRQSDARAKCWIFLLRWNAPGDIAVAAALQWQQTWAAG